MNTAPFPIVSTALSFGEWLKHRRKALDLTRDKLLQLAWFRRLYDWVIWLLAKAHALTDPVKRRVKLWLRIISPKRASRTLRLFRRIRRRMQAARAA